TDTEGRGANRLAVRGNHASRIFTISGGVTVIIAGLTITDGMVVGNDGGGAILNTGSTLTLANDVLSNNEVLSDASGNAQGGAIVNVAGAPPTLTKNPPSPNTGKSSNS